MDDFVFPLVVLCIVSYTIIKVVKLNINAKDKRGYGEEDVRTIQEIYQGLERMDRRVESLETLLLERPHRAPSHDENYERESR